jgi:hypothetical protein
VWRLALGPTAETHKHFGAATSASLTPVWPTNPARTHWAGPLFGLETVGTSGNTRGGFGVVTGIDSASHFPDQRLVLGAGARLGIDLGLPDVQVLARATLHLDLGWQLRAPGPSPQFLGVGIEAGPQFGDRVPLGGFFALSLIYRLIPSTE